MAKGILEFDLEEHFEQCAFKRASSATGAYIILFDLREMFIRGMRENRTYTAERLLLDLNELLDDQGVNLSDLP